MTTYNICPSCRANLTVSQHSEGCLDDFSTKRRPSRPLGPLAPSLACVEATDPFERKADPENKKGPFVAYTMQSPDVYGGSPREAWRNLEDVIGRPCLPINPRARDLLLDPEIEVSFETYRIGPRGGSIFIAVESEDFETRVSFGTMVTLPADLIAVAPSVVSMTVVDLVSKIATSILTSKISRPESEVDDG